MVPGDSPPWIFFFSKKEHLHTQYSIPTYPFRISNPPSNPQPSIINLPPHQPPPPTTQLSNTAHTLLMQHILSASGCYYAFKCHQTLKPETHYFINNLRSGFSIAISQEGGEGKEYDTTDNSRVLNGAMPTPPLQPIPQYTLLPFHPPRGPSLSLTCGLISMLEWVWYSSLQTTSPMRLTYKWYRISLLNRDRYQKRTSFSLKWLRRENRQRVGTITESKYGENERRAKKRTPKNVIWSPPCCAKTFLN